jgi:hypothetical protein
MCFLGDRRNGRRGRKRRKRERERERGRERKCCMEPMIIDFQKGYSNY